MADESPDRDPEIRRRAAWLLAMLALVAALFVGVMVTFFNTSGGGSSNNDLAGPTVTPTPTPSSSSAAPTGTATTSGTSASPSTTSPSTPAGGGVPSCPSNTPCALDSDIGNAVAAINDYRTSNGKAAVPGAVSADAAKCALSNGSSCSGNWAQTQVPATNGKADGAAAVDKIKQLGKLLLDMKSIEVGWAYDPGNKTLYFATVRIT